MHWWMKTLKMIYLQFNTKNEFTFIFYFRFCFWEEKKKRKVEKKNKIRIKRRGDRKTRKQTLSFRSFRFVLLFLSHKNIFVAFLSAFLFFSPFYMKFPGFLFSLFRTVKSFAWVRVHPYICLLFLLSPWNWQ